eukprot:g26937.t1
MPREDAGVFVSCADCRVIIFQTLEEATRIWIKGLKFSLAELLGDAAAKPFLQKPGCCSVAVCRLAPQDYHRFHFPCGPGEVIDQNFLAGEYYSVNPLAVNNPNIDVLTENCRSVTRLQHPSFGQVAFVAVGSTFAKGDCYGYFQYGGSTCVIVTEPGAVGWDPDLLDASARGIESFVKMGEQIGLSCT